MMISKPTLAHRRALSDARGTSHRFKVGEVVRRKGTMGPLLASADLYHITATLPAIGKSPQYRIRSDNEKHERVAVQDDLDPVGTHAGNERDALLERTFGHG
jgi:hypothetical protein